MGFCKTVFDCEYFEVIGYLPVEYLRQLVQTLLQEDVSTIYDGSDAVDLDNSLKDACKLRVIYATCIEYDSLNIVIKELKGLRQCVTMANAEGIILKA
jgi:hypothetical protein